MKIKKVVIGILITVYVLVAVFLTACLITFNDYKVSIFGDKSLIIVKNKEFEPNYKKGSLLIVTKNKNDEIKANDEIFFYNAYKNKVTISYSKVTKTTKITDTQTTYTITGDYDVSSDYVIGKADTTKVINNVGSIMSVLESRWGFIFIIILPIAVAFIYEIYVVVKEIVRPDDEEEISVKKEEKEEEKIIETHEEVKDENVEQKESEEKVQEETVEEKQEEQNNEELEPEKTNSTENENQNNEESEPEKTNSTENENQNNEESTSTEENAEESKVVE